MPVKITMLKYEHLMYKAERRRVAYSGNHDHSSDEGIWKLGSLKSLL